jgi:hypothetical protein
VLYAAFVSAIKEMPVNSVEDGNAHERGAEKSHLYLPVCGRKSISAHQNTGARFLIPFVMQQKRGPETWSGAGPKDCYGRGDQASAHP